MRNWAMLYERQPLQLDAILFALALALHAPLFLVHMKGPAKDSKGKVVAKRVNIDLIEQNIVKRKEKPMALPPKIISKPSDVKKAVQEVQKKVEDKVEQMVKSTPPPPPPKPFVRSLPTNIPLPAPKIQDIQAKAPETKLQADLLKNKLEQSQKVLQSKGSFQDKNLALGSSANREIKMDTGAGTINPSSRMSAIGSPMGGAVVKGKSGFSVGKGEISSIGGDDGIGIKTGEVAIALPTSARSKGDASVMSPTAVIKNRGSLNNQAPGLSAAAGGSASGSGIALAGPSSGGAIAIGGSRGGPAGSPAPAAKKAEKTFVAKGPAAPSEGGQLAQNVAVPIVPRRVKTPKPMFLISGPLQNRAVLSKKVPEYPEWARDKGIEAAVMVQFTVSPDGTVKDNMLVIRTSGYPALDDLAKDALRQWKFAPLPAEEMREETGSITFNFSVL